MATRVDLTGRRFRKLVVVKEVGTTGARGHFQRIWLCKCDCGNESRVSHANLVGLRSGSCGCGKLAARAKFAAFGRISPKAPR